MPILFEALGADLEAPAARQAGPLEIGFLATGAGGIELGGADAVGITASAE